MDALRALANEASRTGLVLDGDIREALDQRGDTVAPFRLDGEVAHALSHGVDVQQSVCACLVGVDDVTVAAGDQL